MVKIIAEIGINHNGSIQKCKEMMLLAKIAGVDYVKIQKRTPVMNDGSKFMTEWLSSSSSTPDKVLDQR